MNSTLRRIAALLAFSATTTNAQSTLERDRALLSIAGLDLSSADIVAWCETSAPTEAPALRTAWQRWRTASAIDDVTAQMSVDLREKSRRGMASVGASARQRLARMGQPATVCRNLVTMWDSETFDTRTNFPLAYAGASAATTAPISTAPGSTAPNSVQRNTPQSNAGAGPTTPIATGALPRAGRRFNPEYYYATARPVGEVYTVLQLNALVQSWYGTPRSYDRARAHMRASAPLFVRGKVVPHREKFYVEFNDSVFTSKLRVSPSVDLSAFEGQEVTVALTLKELPGASLIFPEQTRLVRDPSGLHLSTLSEDAGRRRMEVSVAQITAAPGRGPSPSRIRGMHYRGFGTTGANGYEFREELRLLFTDGWAYTREDLAPTDLDVEASRRLEPQYWERWRQAGADFVFQAQDDFGRPDGEWESKSGRLLGTWSSNQRLAGGYTAAAFNGSIALGGTYSKSTYMLSNDGRWEYLGFSRSSSAAMAAQSPVGFSASASSSTSGAGTSSTAGGGNAGVYTRSSSEKNDGARNRGTYRLDGMTLELRSDAGDVRRYLCVPLDTRGDEFYLLGRSFSRKRE